MHAYWSYLTLALNLSDSCLSVLLLPTAVDVDSNINDYDKHDEEE